MTQYLDGGSSCGSDNIDHGTRVIGYLKRVTSIIQGRQKEYAHAILLIKSKMA
jgi:anaerobic ribonucleoside-triphosphate reductase